MRFTLISASIGHSHAIWDIIRPNHIDNSPYSNQSRIGSRSHNERIKGAP